ncbi:MAG: hypothetical protein R3D43_14510 [Tepidamorphaceae bacterium]|nr:hypothetical protein [Rhodobiaceae bacterium]
MSAKDAKPGDSTRPAKADAAGKDARADRLAAALKANLRRRKAQARGRKDEETGKAGK